MSESYPSFYKRHLKLDSESVPGGFVCYFADGDEEIIHVNKYVIDLFECESEQDFLEHTHGSFRHFVHAEDFGAVEQSIWGQVRNRENLDHVYYRIRTKTGKLVTVADYGRLLPTSEYGRPVFEVFVARISPKSAVDWLTGLSTMTRFHELARISASMMAKLDKRTVAIAFDIMGMKAFNTQYGRDEGDRLLCAFAEALRSSFGGEACSRFGEDHFYVFASEKGIESKVRAVFSAFSHANFVHVPPVRAGLYACDADDDIVAVGFDRAKVACDLDRTTWQSHLTWFTDDMRVDAQLRIHVLEHLDQAIAEGWIRPYYQPVVRSATGKVCEEEALARWVDPEHGVLTPDKFIPVLEEAALLHRLDLHIVDCVLHDFKRKQELGIPIVPVSINISYRDLARFSVARALTMRADAAGIPHDLLHIEFTESAVHSDPALFMKQVAELHEEGFEVWMDDFGSGYSSLNVLQRYEFDVIKLDMEFLRGGSYDLVKARSIVTGIVQTAQRLNVRTLCEGVETEAQAEFLESIGCDMLQGFLFSQPKPLDHIARYAATEQSAVSWEARDEEPYWNAVSATSLSDFTGSDDSQDVAGITISEFPAGVVEQRDGSWRIIRANRPYKRFLRRTGLLDDLHALEVRPIQRELDDEFYIAAKRGQLTKAWERIGGRLEYGTGFQFYIKPVASSPFADAYAVVGVPTLLGTALGSFGDVPVGYVVFRVILSESGDEAVDAEYVYANEVYREWLRFGDMDPTGKSFLQTAPDATTKWLPCCYRAAVLKEHVHDVVFSPESGHWVSFYGRPSPMEGYCVFAFAAADKEHHEREELQSDLVTSDLIIRIASVLNGGMSFEDAMNNLLKVLSEALHPDRLHIFECGDATVSNTFEWCSEGVEPQIHTLQDLDHAEFATWSDLLAQAPVVAIPDVEELRETDPRMYWQLSRQGVTHVLAAPFYDGDQLLGYLAAHNFMLEEGLDAIRVLQTIASFVSARVVNRRLMEAVERMAAHDVA